MTVLSHIILHPIDVKRTFFSLVSISPEPSLSWYRDDALMDETDKYHAAKENLGTCHLEVRKLEFVDQVNIYEIYNHVYRDIIHSRAFLLHFRPNGSV